MDELYFMIWAFYVFIQFFCFSLMQGRGVVRIWQASATGVWEIFGFTCKTMCLGGYHMRWLLGIDGADAFIPFQGRKAWGTDTRNHETISWWALFQPLTWWNHDDRRAFFTLQRIFFSHFIKKLAELEISEAKSSAIQNNSVTLSAVSIAIIVCISLYLSTIELQQFSLTTKFSDN